MGTLSSPSQATLLANVRNLLNQPNAASSFWTDAEIGNYINEAIRIYFAELVKINEGQFGAVTDLDLVNGVETVPLPSDFFSMRAVYKKADVNFIMLAYRNNLTDSYSTEGGTNSTTYIPYYYFRGNNLVLRPIPQFSESAGLRIEYLQFPDTLLTGTDVLTTQITPIFSQVIEMYAVYKAKMKESLVVGVDTSAMAKGNLGELHKQFMDVIQLRSKNPVSVVIFNP